MARWPWRRRSHVEAQDAALAEPDGAEPDAVEADPAPRPGWRGTRLVALVAGVAVVSLLAGIVIMQFVVSPAELAARTAPPDAGPVTASVEERVVENTVVTRGEVTYAGAVDAEIDTSSLEERAVVTGHVPEVGDELKAGDVALEIAGRPAIVLPGALPAYRDLRVGLRGPDVAELKKALAGFDLWAGDPDTDLYDADTAVAVGALYERIGYEAPTGGDEARVALRDAERAVRDADAELVSANRGGDAATARTANDALADAQETLAEAQVAVMPSLPASEVLMLSALPRRVDDVRVARGDMLQGAAMQVSGATLAITGTVAKQDADLLKDGQAATFTGADGTDFNATVESVRAPEKAGSAAKSDDDGGGGSNESAEQPAAARFSVTLKPEKLSAEQVDALRDTNVRLRIPVASTDGAVLAVPIAALSAGSGGEDRIELQLDAESRKTEGEDTVTIPVTAGLAADGYVEISCDDERVVPGAKVVVGT